MGQATVLLVLLGLTGFNYAAKLHNLGSFQPLDDNFLHFQPLPASNNFNSGVVKAQLQPSFDFGRSLFNEVLSGANYLPPPEANNPTPGISCPAAVTVTVTDNSVVTNLQASTAYNNVVVTSTNIQTTTVVNGATITNTETVVNTVSTTQAVTVTNTQTRTEVQTSVVTQPAVTQFVTQIQTVPTVVYVDTTRVQIETNVVPTTISQVVTSTQVIPTQVVKFVTNTATNTVVETIPGQTIFNTQFTTLTTVITQTLSAQTIINTVFTTNVITNAVVSTIGGGFETVVSTQVIPIATTVYNTQFVTVTQTQTVNSNVVITQTQNVGSTQVVPTTVFQVNTQYITVPYENVIQSIITVPVVIAQEVVSTNFNQVTQTVDVTDTQYANQYITVGGGVSNVLSTSFIVNNVVNTVTVTNNVGGGAIVITETVQAPCGGSPTYVYKPPSGRSFNPFRS